MHERNVEKPRPLCCVGVLMGITGYKKNVYEDFPAALCCHNWVKIFSDGAFFFIRNFRIRKIFTQFSYFTK